MDKYTATKEKNRKEYYKRFTIRFNKKDYEKIQKKAEASEMTVSTFVRKSCLQSEIKTYDFKNFYDVKRMISNATNNINQVAKIGNTYHEISESDLRDLKKYVDELKKLLNVIYKELTEVKPIDFDEKKKEEISIEELYKGFGGRYFGND